LSDIVLTSYGDLAAARHAAFPGRIGKRKADSTIMDNRKTISTLTDLTRAGLALGDDMNAIAEVAERYAISITPAMQDRIGPAPDDPVARQFVPSARELLATAEERGDPIGDESFPPSGESRTATGTGSC
jgi:L-lysine 2,3-aminomutase